MTKKDADISDLSDSTLRALKFAELPRGALSIGPNPDTGDPSWVLDATIQQYSAFLASLATQARRAEGMKAIINGVRMENMLDGRTLFWLENLSIPRITR